jgi:hypothetical protein
MNIIERAIYIGTTPKRVGYRDSELYLSYGMTGTVFPSGDNIHVFRSDDGNDWYVEAKDLQFSRA